MARAVCSVCGEPQSRKMASFYWNWTWPTGDRRGYKQLVDAECAAPYLRLARSQMDESELCAHCGDKVDHLLSIDLYCTCYIPGRDRDDWMRSYHAACFEQVFQAFQQGATRLPDRKGLGSGAPRSPAQGTGWESWGQQGITST